MTEQHDTMMYPTIEELLGRTDSKFRLVTLGALRACQINSYFGQLGEGLGAMVPPQVLTMSRKPLSIAFEEIASDKIVAVDPPEVPEEGVLADTLIPTGEAETGGDDRDGADQAEADLNSAS
ncbi:MAG: DNA-directed RNA polymerase subunit omega [bacterium]|nr:DNA-directed RNA polymerase subunit omega [bacterium]MDE0215139.1 DNA-directed RNA polymerase subunit omega [bacterium]